MKQQFYIQIHISPAIRLPYLNVPLFQNQTLNRPRNDNVQVQACALLWFTFNPGFVLNGFQNREMYVYMVEASEMY